MKKLTLAAVALSAALLGAGAADAMPLTSAALAGTGDGVVTLVRGGCGFGAHRGPFGGCRLNRGPRGAIRRATTGAPGGCPPGRYRVRGLCR